MARAVRLAQAPVRRCGANGAWNKGGSGPFKLECLWHQVFPVFVEEFSRGPGDEVRQRLSSESSGRSTMTFPDFGRLLDATGLGAGSGVCRSVGGISISVGSCRAGMDSGVECHRNEAFLKSG